MLARGGPLPTRGRWSYEVKWDGFRAIVRAGDDFRVRSRRGWDMTALVPELEALPAGVYDGELVSFVDGLPYFPAVCARLLNRVDDVVLHYLVFDVLALDGHSVITCPTRSGASCSSVSGYPPTWRSSRTASTTAPRSGTSCASAASRASWRSGSTVATCPGSAAG